MPPMLGLLWYKAPDAAVLECSPTLALSTLSGRLSLLPPKREDGASARMEALVSREFRRRRFDDDARVRMEALSVKILLAVAVV